ncbi:membrane protein insertase YidC [Candidatus Uhrbacteria bacterium]|nr:membrane protein insertase YidC [Candidatus Uhrbacteria bacterium]
MGIFQVVFYHPIYNLLIFLYDVMPFGGIGIAIILVTLLIKGILFPFTFKMLKSQRAMQEIQPKIAEIRKTYKDDREKMAEKLMEVYKDNNVNPMASCLPLIIQLPIFWALYRALRDGVREIDPELLYSFVSNPGEIQSMFLGIDLAEVSITLAVLAAIAQYFQVKRTMARKPIKEVAKKEGAKDENMMANMNKMMLYFIPGMTLVIGVTSMPGGVMLYWLATTFLTLILYSIFLPSKPEEKQD